MNSFSFLKFLLISLLIPIKIYVFSTSSSVMMLICFGDGFASTFQESHLQAIFALFHYNYTLRFHPKI